MPCSAVDLGVDFIFMGVTSEPQFVRHLRRGFACACSVQVTISMHMACGQRAATAN